MITVAELKVLCVPRVCAGLSAAGEQYVDEELKGTLLRVKQVKEMMEKKEEKHRHLMDALRHSSEKKKVNSVRFALC